MQLTIDTPDLADAATRAARVAPNKGEAYDKASGIVLELGGTDAPLVVKATDLEVTYRQCLQTAKVEGEGTWRIPSVLLAGVLSGLPMTGQVVMTDLPDGRVRITHVKAKTTLHQIEGVFPLIKPFDKSSMTMLDDFAQRAAQVTWACHADNAPLSGVHIDGERLAATDRTRIATVPCEVPVANPITVPLATLTTMLKNVGSVRVAATEHRFLMMPDEDTEITAVIFTGAYPDYQSVMRDTFTVQSQVDRLAFAQAITRMMVLVKGERYPLLRLDFDAEQVALTMNVPEVGIMEDVVELLDGPADPLTIHFTPNYLVDALQVATGERATLSYGPDAKQTVSITDGNGYRADLMPRVVGSSV